MDAKKKDSRSTARHEISGKPQGFDLGEAEKFVKLQLTDQAFHREVVRNARRAKAAFGLSARGCRRTTAMRRVEAEPLPPQKGNGGKYQQQRSTKSYLELKLLN